MLIASPQKSKLGKSGLTNAWDSILRTPRFRLQGSLKRRACTSSADFSPTFDHESDARHSDSTNSVVLRRFLDQVSDVAYRADMRRIGEEYLFSDLGEFRHYLSEKAEYNKINRAAGKEIVDVSRFRH